MAERCTVRREPQGYQCPRTDTVAVSAGCVHEHIADGWLCPDDLAKTQAADLCCSECQEGDNPHDCPVKVIAQEADD